MRPTKQELAHLLAAFDRSEWESMELVLGDFHLRLSSRPEGFATPPTAHGGDSRAPSPPSASAAAPSASSAPSGAGAEPRGTSTGAASAAPAKNALPVGAVAVRAPSLGRFWRKPKPSDPAFVDVGAEVKVGDVVCIVEVMKLFTQVKSDVAGKVLACPVTDGAMVEYDDVLFVIQPSGG